MTDVVSLLELPILRGRPGDAQITEHIRIQGEQIEFANGIDWGLGGPPINTITYTCRFVYSIADVTREEIARALNIVGELLATDSRVLRYDKTFDGRLGVNIEFTIGN